MIFFKNLPIYRKILFVGLLPVILAVTTTNIGYFVGMYELERDAIHTEKIVFTL